MKILEILKRTNRTIRRKTLTETKQEVLVESGREQFKRLVDRGLSIPVAYL